MVWKLGQIKIFVLSICSCLCKIKAMIISEMKQSPNSLAELVNHLPGVWETLEEKTHKRKKHGWQREGLVENGNLRVFFSTFRYCPFQGLSLWFLNITVRQDGRITLFSNMPMIHHYCNRTCTSKCSLYNKPQDVGLVENLLPHI